MWHAPSPPSRRYKKGPCPSLASCCDLPTSTPLPLLALESLLPLIVFCSGFARLASVSCTGVSSSGFLCVETNRGRGTGRKTETEVSCNKVERKKCQKVADSCKSRHLPTTKAAPGHKLHNDDQYESKQRAHDGTEQQANHFPSNRRNIQATGSFQQTRSTDRLSKQQNAWLRFVIG